MGERSSRPLLTADKKNTRKKSEKTTTNSFESNRSHFGVGGKGRKILAQKARNIGNRNVTEARCCLSARSETKCLSARSETKSLSARSERKKLRAGDSWERVKVTIRVRPYTKAEAAREVGIPLIKANAQMKSVTVRRKGGTVDSMEFKFDDVLLSAANQADVYNRAAQAIVLDVLDGYNGTILAYGQTGAGKTYTLSAMVIDKYGVQTAEGMVPRSAADIFARVAEDKDHEYHVSMSYIQIYMEIIQDLLRPENLNLQIREGEDGNIFVAGVEEIEVNSVEDVVRLMMLGDSNRFKAFTKMNAHSSRSHAIVILMVEKKALHPFLRRNDITPRKRILKGSGLSENILIGKLFLVDLAGSERLKKSGSEGLRAMEAMSVNMSLTALGKCISARADPSVLHIPFRDSKLTRLLQESFGGNAKTSLIINIAPCSAYIHETLSSLQFGARAMKVHTRAATNVVEEFRVISTNLSDSIEQVEECFLSLQPRLVLDTKNVESKELTEEQNEEIVANAKFLERQRKRSEEWHQSKN